MTNKNSTPVKIFRAGTISVSVFENTVKTKDKNKAVIQTAVFQKRYMDKDGEWRSTGRLNLNDIPRAVMCLQKAYDCIIELRRENTLSSLKNK